jgi:uncharacterized protein (DUF1330 family)
MVFIGPRTLLQLFRSGSGFLIGRFRGYVPMAAYIIVDVKISDPVVYAEYRKLTPASISLYGGQFVVRGGTVETLEGEWSPERIVVLEFPTVAQAKAWWSSAEYAPAKALRHKSATTEMIVVEGV